MHGDGPGLQVRVLSLAQRLCFVTPTTNCTVLVGTGASPDDTLGPLRNGSGCRKASVSQVAVMGHCVHFCRTYRTQGAP